MTKTREIINRLVSARKVAGLSQTEAAKLLGYTNASSLSAIESDYRDTEPSLSMFLKMCEIYNVSPIWALSGKKPDFNEREIQMLKQISNSLTLISELEELRKILEQRLKIDSD